MKFALVDGIKTEASKGAKGICPSCGSEMIANCGEVYKKHWSHKSIRNCDPWWENETEWHRSWKNNFPYDWQEFIFTEEGTGEKHIADVRTIHGLVIEFQHSYIAPQERTTRERFYKNMVWIVDGTRLKRDFPRFLKGMNDIRKTELKGHFLVDFPDECFPSAWLGSSVPVLFDFRGTESIDDPKDIDYLYCLFPMGNKENAILAIFTRESFIKGTIHGEVFKQQPEPQNQKAKPPTQNNNVVRRRESTHYYDTHKRQMVKKWRF